MDGVLVRFGEIGIKSAPVRRSMVERLRRNLLSAMEALRVEGDVQARGPRLWMAGHDMDGLVRAAQHTFGVVSCSPARTAPADLATLESAAVDLALAQTGWSSFAVRASRDGQHPFTSQDIAVRCGDAVRAALQAQGRPARVDLGKPDLEVHVEVRDAVAYVHAGALPGPGGLPTGSQGRVVVLLSDRASAVAAWLVMRRGCWAEPLHASATGAPPEALQRALHPWGLPPARVVRPPGGAIAKSSLLDAAAQWAASLGAAAVVTGDTLGSALLAAPIPVLRPVCGLAPSVVAGLEQSIGLGGAGMDGDGAAPLDPAAIVPPAELLGARGG